MTLQLWTAHAQETAITPAAADVFRELTQQDTLWPRTYQYILNNFPTQQPSWDWHPPPEREQVAPPYPPPPPSHATAGTLPRTRAWLLGTFKNTAKHLGRVGCCTHIEATIVHMETEVTWNTLAAAVPKKEASQAGVGEGESAAAGALSPAPPRPSVTEEGKKWSTDANLQQQQQQRREERVDEEREDEEAEETGGNGDLEARPLGPNEPPDPLPTKPRRVPILPLPETVLCAVGAGGRGQQQPPQQPHPQPQQQPPPQLHPHPHPQPQPQPQQQPQAADVKEYWLQQHEARAAQQQQHRQQIRQMMQQQAEMQQQALNWMQQQQALLRQHPIFWRHLYNRGDDEADW
ncbi:unnamed protein product [Vitrella brassicaformis CCMP3155]|uniref:Uncharacterized protein n=1 Tax=Vitrella brassicaformis (strain CCMP3155) TaxID=1169540 RepID=A0A0G4G843_VITBC|nr:unnamed protein product [Vitrella brassicaformis CCMP3155]|eukprot:CEM25051.1 unnamed protein product [Vitrella brassicaformis CCMP3155]